MVIGFQTTRLPSFSPKKILYFGRARSPVPPVVRARRSLALKPDPITSGGTYGLQVRTLLEGPILGTLLEGFATDPWPGTFARLTKALVYLRVSTAY